MTTAVANTGRVRVAIVIDQLGPGGAEQLLPGLAGAAPHVGLDLSVVSLKSTAGPVVEALRAAGVPVRSLAERRLSDPRGALALGRALDSIQPDVVHSHLQYADVLSALVVPRGTRLVSTLHVMACEPGARAAVRERLAGAARRRRADRIIAVSAAAARWYTARHAVRPGQLVVVPNGVSPSTSGEPQDVVRRRLGLPNGAFVVAMVGVMRPGKGHLEAIAAVERMTGERDAVLLLVGDGPLKSVVEDRARTSPANVHVLGHRTDVPELLTASDALVLPSAVEALPTVVIEAMAAGVPVVAARSGGTPELVSHGATGLLARPGDVAELGAHLSRLAADPALARRLGDAGRRRHGDEFTAERWAERLRRIYGDIVEEPASRRRRLAVRPVRPRITPVDALVLDAAQRQALVAIRSLGRAGIATCAVGLDMGSPAFASRWCRARALAPDPADDPDAFVDAILEVLQLYPARVILPSHDGSIDALRARRDELEQRACVALAREDALAIAIDKRRTFAAASELGIGVPRSLEAGDLEDARAAWRAIGFPAVVKPTRSWVRNGRGGHRVTSEVVTTEEEAEHAAAALVADEGRVLVQEWLSGTREAVSLLLAQGRIWARFAQVAHRMTPALGGSSVLRESVTPAPDVAQAAERLVHELGLEGYSEVEFRRDAYGRPRLMEINPRLSASVEIAVRAGVDFPRLIYAWAAGDSLAAVPGYRTGLQMRWLGGDVEWLREVVATQGRPDIPPLGRAVATFARDFARPLSYDYVDLRDPLPAVTATATAVAGLARRGRKRREREGGARR